MKANKSHDGREAWVDLEIGVKQEEAEKKFGEAFAILAFSTMRVQEAQGEDETDGIVFLQDAIKPGRVMVAELHNVDIEGNQCTVQPELLRIRTVKGEARVVAMIRVPIDVSKASLINAMTKQVGKSVRVEFDPAQGVLSFPDADADGNGKMRVVKARDEEAAVDA